MIGVGVLGAGYWGPKHVRNFCEMPQARMVMVADLSERRLAAIEEQHPSVETTTDYRAMLARPDIQAIVVATPVSTHARFARECLMAGKHVMVEKPLARTSAECRELMTMAEERGLTLMVGHTFIYNPAVRVLRDLVQCGELGDVYYVHAQRLNLGLFQRDINVLWDLAPHDLSILMYVLGQDPVSIGARGSDYVQPGIEDVAYMDVVFPNRVRATVHCSWLDPNKVRRLTIVGSKKMAVYDDVEPLEKIRVYDKGVDAPERTVGFGEFQLSYRYGDISIPQIPGHEPLRMELSHFVDCCASGQRPTTDGERGLRVVEALEASDASLAAGGMMVPMPAGDAASAASHPSLGFPVGQVLRDALARLEAA